MSSAALSSYLKKLRTERSLTLKALAEESGISRATLSRIENGDVSPTADTLGALSSVYGLPISVLLSPLEQNFQAFIARGEQQVWCDSKNGFERRSVSPPSRYLKSELIEGRLSANQSISYSAPSMPGQEHHVLLLSGALSITVEESVFQLKSGDCVRYKLFGASRFETGRLAARYIIALTSGE